MSFLPKGLVLNPNSKLELQIYKNRCDYFYKSTFHTLWTSYERLLPHQQEVLVQWFAAEQEKQRQSGTLEKIESVWDKAISISDEEVSKVELLPTFPKITDDFVRLIKLYRHYCVGLEKRPNLEVAVLFWYHPEYNRIDTLLPEQNVTGGSVNWNIGKNKKLAYLDGRSTTVQHLLNEGWILIGTSHSHNTLTCTWSSVDDADLCGTFKDPKPTGVHLLIYNFDNYESEDDMTFKWIWSASANGDFYHIGHSENVLAAESNILQVVDLAKMDESATFDDSITKLATVYTGPKTTKVYGQNYSGYDYNFGWYGQGYGAYTGYRSYNQNNNLAPVGTSKAIQDSKTYNIDAIRHHAESMSLDSLMEHVAKFLEDIRINKPNVTTEDIVLTLLEKSSLVCEGLFDLGMWVNADDSLDVLSYDADPVEHEDEAVDLDDVDYNDPFLVQEYLDEGYLNEGYLDEDYVDGGLGLPAEFWTEAGA